MKKAVIFDLDGTLWNSSKEVADSWSEVLLKEPDIKRAVTEQELRGYMGKTLDVIGENMLPDIPEQRRNQVMRECCENEIKYILKHGAPLFPKLSETLSALRENYGTIIVSNCQDGYIQCFLEVSGLKDLFDDFECAGRTGLQKGGNIKLVIERGKFDRAFYLGDTAADLEASEFAGVPFIWAAYGFGQVPRFSAKIESFEELPAAVKKLDNDN